jgi:hypothetical protein
MGDEQPKQCKVVLDELFQRLAWLHHYWHFYLALYGSSAERFDVYNERSPHVFGLFEKALRESILLELAKLLGSHKSSGHQVVSIKRAMVDLPFRETDSRKLELYRKAEALTKKHDAIITMRDRSIAHTDLAVVMEVEPLDGVSRAMIREAVTDCVTLTNEVLRLYSGSGYGFHDGGGEEHDVQVLLNILKLGNAELDRQHAERQRRWQERYQTDVALPDDPLDEDPV